jgi:mannosyltransferase OCH1-like enzyme
MGGLSNFTVKEVNSSNLKDFIDLDIIEKIDYTLKNAKMTVFTQTKSDLVRLALLYKHGGVYIDASTLAV